MYSTKCDPNSSRNHYQSLGAQIKLGRPNFNLICKLGRPNLKLGRPNLFRSAYLVLLGRPNNFF